jgi:uncharacterized protein (TIGR00304 family)
MDAETLYSLGIVLILTGMTVILVAILMLFFTSARKGEKARGGGAIIIGPFPIVFGTDKESIKKVLLLSLALTAILVIAMIVHHSVFR